ncbi:hypothetical protein [Caballeronia sp. NCTM1]|uniref:hypothetical protein n=1 Tax=Caballeronia sp. NCTM1 TaxID=2921753 RepID=UPI0020280720|nr:hypothetical protein [Caballeronia sp. NCTM1]
MGRREDEEAKFACSEARRLGNGGGNDANEDHADDPNSAEAVVVDLVAFDQSRNAGQRHVLPVTKSGYTAVTRTSKSEDTTGLIYLTY